ncbi:metallophosphoesterase family protein [Erysipelothrix sp. HDW6A]|uniref:metallophosphoesterase family protein n=1 Tax=Erysipelothrix sp. HDW6A TaxID=2714928 RepID=UPI00140E0DBC|nr:YfcE family phosphodiesterase [Erysipelothrix sp. HDW6A]QIK57493.1 metallophosphoesterase family protein [Erysipelothrix sp. HDW6A]
MKIAILSDIHGNYTALKLALADLCQKDIDSLVLLGDLITDGHEDNEIIDELSSIALVSILGNRERSILRIRSKDVPINLKPIMTSSELLTAKSVKYISLLKSFEILKKNNTSILLIHGDQNIHDFDDLTNFYDELIALYDFDICLFGHTHKHQNEVYKGKKFINPGSLGIPTRDSNYTYGILDIETQEFSVEKLPIEPTFVFLFDKYVESEYFKENPIWSMLILDSIKFSTNRVNSYFEIIEMLMEENTTIGFEEAWISALEVYLVTYSSTVEITLIQQYT